MSTVRELLSSNVTHRSEIAILQEKIAIIKKKIADNNAVIFTLCEHQWERDCYVCWDEPIEYKCRLCFLDKNPQKYNITKTDE